MNCETCIRTMLFITQGLTLPPLLTQPQALFFFSFFAQTLPLTPFPSSLKCSGKLKLHGCSVFRDGCMRLRGLQTIFRLSGFFNKPPQSKISPATCGNQEMQGERERKTMFKTRLFICNERQLCVWQVSPFQKHSQAVLQVF